MMRALRALRLSTGLVLVVFITVHFFNHALGIVSVDAQEGLRRVLSPVWRSLPGTVLLYFALLVHPLLGYYALWRRRTLRMPAWELAQLVLGLTVPLLLIPHVFGTRVAAEMLDAETTYPNVVGRLWSSPETMIRQPLLVLVVWTHLLLGLHYWLRLRDGYRRLLPVLVPLAIMVPLLALLGFWGAGFELQKPGGTGAAGPGKPALEGRDGDPALRPGDPRAGPRPPPELQQRFDARKDAALASAAGLLAAVLLGRAARHALRARRGAYRIVHAGGRTLVAPLGQSLLEALRDARVPHASVCGGRARCTTCRVRVGRGLDALPAPNSAEALALRRIRAEPNVRLACQLRPDADLHVTPLLPADARPAAAGSHAAGGHERAVAVMFVDLRESSRLAEHRLPYDVVFILNRFFAEMAEALRETGGYYSTFNGDGFMALYGIESELGQGCRDALRGAAAVARRLAQINAALASELPEPLRVGIGIHAGEAIVGRMGPPDQPIVSALGDTVNVAARLEAQTKQHGCLLVVSAACADAAGVDLSAFPAHTVGVRGRVQAVSYRTITEVADLEAALARSAPTPPAAAPRAREL